MAEGQKLVRAYARKLLDLEVASTNFSRPHSPEHEPLLNYVRSTINRRSFCLYCIIASMDDEPITPSYVANQLGASRNAVDTMVQECEKNEWIIVDRDERAHRTMYSTVLMQEAYIDYAEWVSKTSDHLGFANIQGAIKLLQSTTK